MLSLQNETWNTAGFEMFSTLRQKNQKRTELPLDAAAKALVCTLCDLCGKCTGD